MELYLIRHGDMAGDSHKQYEPPVTGCLSELGCEQVIRLSESLKAIQLSAVYASPLGRAVQTAQALCEPRSLQMTIVPWLIEWRPASAMGECDDAAYESLMAKAALIRPELSWKTAAGEGTLEMAHRIIPGFLKLMSMHGVHAGHGGYLMDDPDDSQCIAFVAHGGSLGQLAAFLLGVPLRPHSPVSFEKTGVARFRLVRRVDVWYPVMEIPAP